MNKIIEAALAVGGAALAIIAGDKVLNKKTKSTTEETAGEVTTTTTVTTAETNTETPAKKADE